MTCSPSDAISQAVVLRPVMGRASGGTHRPVARRCRPRRGRRRARPPGTAARPDHRSRSVRVARHRGRRTAPGRPRRHGAREWKANVVLEGNLEADRASSSPLESMVISAMRSSSSRAVADDTWAMTASWSAQRPFCHGELRPTDEILRHDHDPDLPAFGLGSADEAEPATMG